MATYRYHLLFFKNAPIKVQLEILAKMQRHWISRAFCTSPTGGLEALTGHSHTIAPGKAKGKS